MIGLPALETGAAAVPSGPKQSLETRYVGAFGEESWLEEWTLFGVDADYSGGQANGSAGQPSCWQSEIVVGRGLPRLGGKRIVLHRPVVAASRWLHGIRPPRQASIATISAFLTNCSEQSKQAHSTHCMILP